MYSEYKVTRYCSITFSLGFTMQVRRFINLCCIGNGMDDDGILNAQYKGDQISLMLGVECLFKK